MMFEALRGFICTSALFLNMIFQSPRDVEMYQRTFLTYDVPGVARF